MVKIDLPNFVVYMHSRPRNLRDFICEQFIRNDRGRFDRVTHSVRDWSIYRRSIRHARREVVRAARKRRDRWRAK